MARETRPGQAELVLPCWGNPLHRKKPLMRRPCEATGDCEVNHTRQAEAEGGRDWAGREGHGHLSKLPASDTDSYARKEIVLREEPLVAESSWQRPETKAGPSIALERAPRRTRPSRDPRGRDDGPIAEQSIAGSKV